ncbi:Negative regulator of mitosis [Lecanosticta acicola]|uniref:Negative regulator of mitosis n=1 Tax=Lecanosticta acicola TaxID=111012 RepID=A0AAI9EFH3_9PEZI|nr:Negative regulator of mitosis [Lecanosticta acicola]
MAAVESLGVHSPTGLPYLISEGFLPPDPKPEQYQWYTYIAHEGGEDVEEEIISTKKAVVWSQGRFVRNIYRFELEGEDVVQAILTYFPTSSRVTPNVGGDPNGQGEEADNALEEPGIGEISTSTVPLARALVVLLKSKAHIYFLKGSSHILDLPFEVERAFAAPRGLVLQRKRTIRSSLPSTPQIPKAPSNSFFSSQGNASSFLRTSTSPTLAKTFARTSLALTRPFQPSPLGGHAKLDALFQDSIAAHGSKDDDDITNLYTLSSPLSELGVVTYSLQHHKPRIHGRSQPGLSVEFEGLDPGEQIVYVSSRDELAHSQSSNSGEMILLVTFNADINTVTVWHAWYIEEKSLKALLKLRAEHKAARARRRSSFMNANLGTGAATPALRRRDGTRESFAAGGLNPGDPVGSQGTALSRKPTRQEEEAAMASQMDPDYLPAGSQPQQVRESRRISSMNADVRASQNTVNASFGGTGSRRATSFGGTQGRRSLTHRKSRGSTPGSTYGQSLGGDDEPMDHDSTIEFDSDENVDDILRHIRATFDHSGTDGIFGSIDDDFKRELIVRKIYSFPVGLATSQGSQSISNGLYKAIVCIEPLPFSTSDDQKIKLYLHDHTNSEVQYATLRIKNRSLWPGLERSPVLSIPLLVGEGRIDGCEDILKLRDGDVEAVLFGGRGIQFSLDEQTLCPLPPANPYRFFDPLEPLHQEGDDNTAVGRSRTVQPPQSPKALRQAGRHSTFDEVGSDGTHHRRRLLLKPSNTQVDQLLSICEIVLPKHQARSVRRLWCEAYARIEGHPGSLAATSSCPDFVAFAATIFGIVIDCLDSKAKAALNISKVAAGNEQVSVGVNMRLFKRRHLSRLMEGASCAWMSTVPTRTLQRSRRSDELRKDQLLIFAATIADEMSHSSKDISNEKTASTAVLAAVRLMLALHVFREEQKLCPLSATQHPEVAPIIAQLGLWLGLEEWTPIQGKYYDSEGASEACWSYLRSKPTQTPQLGLLEQPISIFQWFEHSLQRGQSEGYPSLSSIAQIGGDSTVSRVPDQVAQGATPRIVALSNILAATGSLTTSPSRTVQLLSQHMITVEILETLPESVAAPFREAIARCEKQPPTTWRSHLTHLVGREDLNIGNKVTKAPSSRSQAGMDGATRDVHTACHAVEHSLAHAKTKEAGRHAVSRLIFSEDRRLVEATSLMHFNSPQVAQCPKQPDWDEATHFEHQRRILNFATIRMIALPAGDAMIHFDCQTPLLTEKYHLPGFSNSCVMQPMGLTMTADRSGLTEEKVNWAYFHAGVSAGLRISRQVEGIDTSWIAFNKPNELTNRHAGFLLALGLGGHLRHLAKWLSFKYLTPKHTMTSVGLLLGLSASYLGTMDSLITRMLSVHITRMLPPGAAELNVSPATQTAGLMGIGLLYYNTSHRRMSEIMMSEIEHMEIEDPDNGPDMLRDESYRLAAGLALGFINLGKGNDLRGLHGMRLPERLLAVAVGPRPVNAVHVFDRATAGAVVAVALVFMKTGDRAIARKIDIPDTQAQFDQVRPDILMLRAMAKQIILWDEIQAGGGKEQTFVDRNLPTCYKDWLHSTIERVRAKRTIDSTHIPMFSIVTGLAWALGLKYAGTGNEEARNELLALLKGFNIIEHNADSFYFDAKLTRAALRRCIDVVALCAAMVMAGTGDLEVLRYLRRMHGTTDAETPYGSHLASHLAIGILFLGGGTFSLGTSNLAIASLICAFYPLFPTDVHDNRVHLQAFRHLWVLAAEARCIVVEDIDTQRPIHMPIKVTLKSGETRMLRAPCLVPELDTIATVETDDPSYWRVTLDFTSNPIHLASFQKDQRIYVRRCPAAEAHTSVFSAALAALNHPSAATSIWHSLFNLPAFKDLDQADIELLLPPDAYSSVYTDERGTVVDDRLVLGKAVQSGKRDELWNLRLLFAWAERCPGEMKWLGDEVVQRLKARIEERARRG